MAEIKNSEIVLLGSTYQLNNLTALESRARLSTTLLELDQASLSEPEIRKYFEAIKLAMGIFIQKVSVLESDIATIRKEQAASENRMEAMYLRAQLEIQGLRTEISEIKRSRGRINQIVRVAEALQGNAYAPYAVKSLVDGVINSNSNNKQIQPNNSKLPSDFPTRVEFAQKNGFKWNHNNRIPTKPAKQIAALEEWENQFCSVEKMSLEQVLNKSYVVSRGPGAIAGALMRIERELGRTLMERESLSVFNCYQKAIRLYKDTTVNPTAQTPCIFEVKMLVSAAFCHLPLPHIDSIEKRLKTKVLSSRPQVVSSIKKIASKSVLPAFIKWAEKHSSDAERLYALQSGDYDNQIEEFVQRYAIGDGISTPDGSL